MGDLTEAQVRELDGKPAHDIAKALGLKTWLRRDGDEWFQDADGNICSDRGLIRRVAELAQQLNVAAIKDAIHE